MNKIKIPILPNFSMAIQSKNKNKVIEVYLTFATYIFISIIFLYNQIIPHLEDRNPLRWSADTLTYLQMAKENIDVDIGSLISVNLNSLGPVTIAKVLNNDLLFIAIFGILLLIFSVVSILSVFSIDKLKFTLLLLANPMLLVSTLTLNKEIIGLFVVSIFICFLETSYKARHKIIRKLYVIGLIFLSLAVRWQLTAIIIVFLLIEKLTHTSARWRRRSVLILTMIISITFPFMSIYLDFKSAFSLDVNLTDSTTKNGSIFILNQMQDNFMFFVVVIPKIAMNLFADSTKIFALNDEYYRLAAFATYIDVYNDYINPLHCLAVLLITLSIIRDKIIRKTTFTIQSLLANKIYLFTIIYCIVSAMAPFIQPRYFFPLYPLICLEASRFTDFRDNF